MHASKILTPPNRASPTWKPLMCCEVSTKKKTQLVVSSGLSPFRQAGRGCPISNTHDLPNWFEKWALVSRGVSCQSNSQKIKPEVSSFCWGPHTPAEMSVLHLQTEETEWYWLFNDHKDHTDRNNRCISHQPQQTRWQWTWSSLSSLSYVPGLINTSVGCWSEKGECFFFPMSPMIHNWTPSSWWPITVSGEQVSNKNVSFSVFVLPPCLRPLNRMATQKRSGEVG